MEKNHQQRLRLTMHQSYIIPFHTKPKQNKITYLKPLSASERLRYRDAVNSLLEQKAILPCQHTKNEFISSFFLRKKPNGKYRFILNLQGLNKFVDPPHFKIEDLRSVQNLLFKNYYMTSIDLKDAYFLIPVHKKFKKYLRFQFENQLYEFSSLPFGLSTAPYVFTKTLKPVIHHLRSMGITLVIYLDDILIIGKTKEICSKNTKIAIEVLTKLGFIINNEKSVLIPSQTCRYLGFILDSRALTISLPKEKEISTLQMLKQFEKIKNVQLGNLQN